MATNVCMQTPISDYGNFGDSISDNFTQTWNAANERALKLKITDLIPSKYPYKAYVLLDQLLEVVADS